MTQVIPQNFLTLAVSMKFLNEAEVRAKYPEEIATKILTTSSNLSEMVDDNNHGFAIKVDHYHYITKDKSKATAFVHIDKGAGPGIKIIKEMKDPNDTHKYSAKDCIKEINKRLRREGIEINFNMYVFGLFLKYYGIKENQKLCYVYKVRT